VDIRLKLLLISAMIFFGLGAIFILQTFSLGKLRIIACDVGQGDGLLIITPHGKQIVVDGGPDGKIIDCLSRYMPFWDHEIELMVSTHPQQDHMAGLVIALSKYKVDTVMTTGVVNKTAMFEQWKKELSANKPQIYTPNAGDELVVDNSGGSDVKLDVLWPTREKIDQWRDTPPSDLNDSSVIFRLNYGPPDGGFCAYFDGDIPYKILEQVIDRQCPVLKVAHHGSMTGTDQQVLSEVRPQVALIQVGAKNKFGHPHKQVLDMLSAMNVKVERNDLSGDVEVDSDGKSYWVTSDK